MNSPAPVSREETFDCPSPRSNLGSTDEKGASGVGSFGKPFYTETVHVHLARSLRQRCHNEDGLSVAPKDIPTIFSFNASGKDNALT